MKRYFISESYEPFKNFLVVDENDLTEKVVLANTVRVPKRHIEDIEEYIIESIDSDETMEFTDAEEYLFLTLDELTSDEAYYLFQDGYIHLEELELLEYVPRDCFNQQDEEYEKCREMFKEYLKQSIVAKMKADGFEASYLDSYTAYIYWDGSNIREEVLEDEQGFTDWYDYTDEFAGMEEVERKQENTGHYVLYQLKDGSKVLVYVSYWQGNAIDSLAFLPDVQNIDEAIEYVKKEFEKYYGGYDGIC